MLSFFLAHLAKGNVRKFKQNKNKIYIYISRHRYTRQYKKIIKSKLKALEKSTIG
jgi:epoxyqueuosine reductase QueG